VSYHDYEGVMLVLCTPLQAKCYHNLLFLPYKLHFIYTYLVLISLV